MSSGSPALTLAEDAYGLVQADPQAAAALAERALLSARAERDVAAQVTAVHALAWAQHVLGDSRAAASARRGIRLGERHGNRRAVALLRRRLSMTLAFAGDLRGARREFEAALVDLRGSDAAQSEVFRITIERLAHSADPAEHRAALSRTASALRRLRQDGDEIWEARLLFNRGMLHSDRGELEAAEHDLRRAGAIYSRLGAHAAAADATVAIAELALFRGDLVEYLRVSDERRADLPPGDLAIRMADHRAAALAQARLLPEARAAALEYIALCERGGRNDSVPRALLDLAAIAIAAGDAETARTYARTAVKTLSARGKPVNAALARLVELRAEIGTNHVRRSSYKRALDAATLLEEAGWRRDAHRARLVAIRLAVDVGAQDVARRELENVHQLGRTGTSIDRIELMHTRALVHAADGHPHRALRALRLGAELLHQYQAGFGSIELRSSSSALGEEISQLGLGLALRFGRRPDLVLTWAERSRANALRLPLVRPSPDTELRAQFVELRRLAARAREAEQTGIAAPRLAARQRAVEVAIRARLRHLGGSDGANRFALDRRSVQAALGERVLIEYVTIDDRLHAITCARGRLTIHVLDIERTRSELEWLRFGLRNAARTSDRSTGISSPAAVALDEALLGALPSRTQDAPLIVVPTGALHAVPWSALPSLVGRPVTVAPSIVTWLDLETHPRRRSSRDVLVAGPRVPNAVREVRAIAKEASQPTLLSGRRASVAETLDALDGAGLAHIACHGTFRSDNPLFSSLELADGPLTALDIQQLHRVPAIFVLSACDLALSDLHPGDELLGFSASLLAAGARTIVASVVPIPDAATRRVMIAFHRGLAGGLTPAVALAGAQANAPVPGFVCIGSG